MGTLKIKALQIGSEARAWTEAAIRGSVHSCFAKVLNIELYGNESGHCQLISVCRPDVPMSPMHISINMPLFFDKLFVKEGDMLSISAEALAFPSLIIHLKEAHDYTPYVLLQAEPATISEVADLCDRLIELDLHYCCYPQEGFFPLLSRLDRILARNENKLSEDNKNGDGLSGIAMHALPILEQMSRAMARGNTEAFWQEARNLLGFGPGLTPSGDDFLTGIMMASINWLRIATANSIEIWHEENYREIWHRLLVEAPRLTSAISCQQLKLAAQGYSNEIFERICWRLLQADKRVLADLPDLARIGATSGQDYLVGLIFWIKFINKMRH